QRCGAPFWLLHRGDLQRVLHESVMAIPQVGVQLGVRVDDFAIHSNGATVAGSKGLQSTETHGSVLIGADGLWSTLRERLGHRDRPRFARHTAWRALVPAEAV